MDHVDEDYWNSLGEPQYDENSSSFIMTLVQEYPMTFPFASAIYGARTTQLQVPLWDAYNQDEVEMEFENHSALYLNN